LLEYLELSTFLASRELAVVGQDENEAKAEARRDKYDRRALPGHSSSEEIHSVNGYQMLCVLRVIETAIKIP
jgi:hypothetical protein